MRCSRTIAIVFCAVTALWAIACVSRARVGPRRGTAPPPSMGTTQDVAGGGTCEDEVLDAGHSRSATVHCNGNVDPMCARAVLRAGHSPSGLVHCRRQVHPVCAQAVMRAGHSPSALVHCRGKSDMRCVRRTMRSGRSASALVHCR